MAIFICAHPAPPWRGFHRVCVFHVRGSGAWMPTSCGPRRRPWTPRALHVVLPSAVWPIRVGDHLRATPVPFQNEFWRLSRPPPKSRDVGIPRTTWGTKTPPRLPRAGHPTRPGSCAAETMVLGPSVAHLGGLLGWPGSKPQAQARSQYALSLSARRQVPAGRMERPGGVHLS
jgi:hypothetical protein